MNPRHVHFLLKLWVCVCVCVKCLWCFSVYLGMATVRVVASAVFPWSVWGVLAFTWLRLQQPQRAAPPWILPAYVAFWCSLVVTQWGMTYWLCQGQSAQGNFPSSSSVFSTAEGSFKVHSQKEAHRSDLFFIHIWRTTFSWYLCLTRRWERAIINQRNSGTVSEAMLGETSERQDGAHMAFSERLDTILNWMEEKVQHWAQGQSRIKPETPAVCGGMLADEFLSHFLPPCPFPLLPPPPPPHPIYLQCVSLSDVAVCAGVGRWCCALP